MRKNIKIALAAVLAACALLNITGCSENREQGSNSINGSESSSSKPDTSSSDTSGSNSSSSDTSEPSSSSSDTSESNSSSSDTSGSSSSDPDLSGSNSSSSDTSGSNSSTPDTSSISSSGSGKQEPEKSPITLSGSNTVNSIRLFDAITADKDNAMFSPLSLNMALGLVEAGAEGETKAALDLYLQMNDYADFAQHYLKHASENLTKEERQHGGWEIHPRSVVEIANSVWTDDAMPLKDEYKQRVGSKFGAEIQNVDFHKKPETLDKINGWVNEKTHEMIPAILNDYDENHIAAVLINTVYFEAAWDFDEWRIDENNKESFTLTDGIVKEIPLMHSYGDSYFENSKATAFSRDYNNGTKFIGILPKKSGEFTLEELDIPSLLKSESGKYDVSAAMPRLKFDTDIPLKELLCAAGLEIIFDQYKANFSGMSDIPLYISEALQKTSLELDEKGTKASAATMMNPYEGGGGEVLDRKTVRLDRPFAFMIYDPAERQILFVGKVTDP